MLDLKIAAEEIRQILDDKRKELGLEFFEDNHKYNMKGLDGELRSDFPSVSKLLKNFYEEFPTEEAALKKAKGDYKEAERLKEEWKMLADESTNLGSRTHYHLEVEALSRFGINKEVRQPVFECDIFSEARSDSMIRAGHKYLDLCDDRGLVLLDTEIVLGHPELGYTGQGDKVWLTLNANGTEIGFLVTDWKTNKQKNFETNKFTKTMYHPFDLYPNNALGHYYLQLPFYGKLLLKMLEGTKYGDMKLLGSIVVLLKDDGDYQEYRVPKDVINTVLNMDMKNILG